MQTSPPSFSALRCSAFSLIEVLTVTAIFSLVALLVTPSVSSILQGDRVTSAATGLAQVFDQARAYAMAQNTPVYVGFATVAPDSEANSTIGTGKVVVAAFALKGGGTSFTQGNELLPISPVKQFSGVSLVESLPGVAAMERPSADLSIFPDEFPALPDGLQLGAWRFTQALRFDPQGSAWASSEMTPRGLFELCLRPAHGERTDEASPNVVALQIDGLTGSVRIFRP